ncbi:MAG: hypothetical protein EZS28_019041 [Streblomastix strix]|uniref:Right handed beta helix domain-containing protein n=1 Tax=Streblomastix strix TaxID=222440 RepID=A0A5J4VSX6_9EUKA|nr:MAG: hypothetical protein EZS28_019041 [Streblomastix strix]
MLTSLLIAFLCLTAVQRASILKNENIGNEIIEYYVERNVQDQKYCGPYNKPCRQIDTVFDLLNQSNQYIIHVYEGYYDHDLSSYDQFKDTPFPTVNIVAEQEAQIDLIGSVYPIGKITISFSKFDIDFGDLYFLIDDDISSLKFSSCNLFRNSGNNAVNSYSLAVVNRGSFIIENLNINGGKIEGNEPLILSISPKLINITSLNITNLALVSGHTEPLLLNVTELEQQSNINISDVHVELNTAGNQAEAGVIFIHTKEQVACSKNNEDSSTNPILLIENSEIIQNTLAPTSQASTIKLEGLNPHQFLIKNSTINNRSPPNNNKAYELKIALPKDCEPKDLITQFQSVDFGITLYPVVVKVPPNEQFDYLILPLSDQYANIKVNSNGSESCTSYVQNFYNDIRTLSCAMIIMKAQDSLGLFKGRQRSVSITGSFTENDLRTDGLTVSFNGTNFLTSANMISFKPNIPTLYSMNDNALFRIRDGGLVTLNNLFISRSNLIGSENAPIAMIISGVGQQSNVIRKNAPGQIVIEKCILEGGNSVSSNVWYNLGLAETCNVGYGAAIVADGQSIVQISGSTFRTFEGPAVRALNGAYVTIDKNTILNNNGLRNRNTLSSMQTNAVCEGGSGTTSVNVALDNVTSFTSTGNGWIFSPSESSCDVKATLNGEIVLPRSIPKIDQANVIVNITNQQDKITVNGRFLEPCLSSLVLEIHEKNKADAKVTLEFGIESSYPTIEYLDSENIIFQFPYTQLKDLDQSVEWEISIYESGKREQTNWLSIQPTVIDTIPDQPGDDQSGETSTKIDIKLILSIVLPIAVFIIAVIIIFIIVIACIKSNDKKHSDLHHKGNEDTLMDDLNSLNENEKNESDRYVQRREILYQVDKPTKDTDEDYIAELVGNDQHSSPFREKQDIRKHPAETVNANITSEDQQQLNDELNNKIQTQTQQNYDSIKPSQQIGDRNDRQLKRFNNEKGEQLGIISAEYKRSESISSDSSIPTSASDSSDSDSDSDSNSSSSHRSNNDQRSSSSQIETRDVNEPKEMSEQSQKKKSKKQQNSNQNKSSKNKIKYLVKDEVKQEVYSEDEAENDSRSVSTSSLERSNYSEDDEKREKKVSKIAKAKSKPIKKHELNKEKPKQSEIKQSDKTSEQKDTKTQQIKKNKSKKSDEKQHNDKDQKADPEEKIEHDNIIDARSESKSTSEVSSTEEQQTPYHSDGDSSSKVSKQNKINSEEHSLKGESIESDNAKKDGIVVTLSKTNRQSSEESKGVTTGSLPPSIGDEDAVHLAPLNIPEKYL